MGTVDTGVVNTDIRHNFEQCNVYNKPECQKCWAKFYCSGGCVANSFNSTATLSLLMKLAVKCRKSVLSVHYDKAVEAQE